MFGVRVIVLEGGHLSRAVTLWLKDRKVVRSRLADQTSAMAHLIAGGGGARCRLGVEPPVEERSKSPLLSGGGLNPPSPLESEFAVPPRRFLWIVGEPTGCLASRDSLDYRNAGGGRDTRALASKSDCTGAGGERTTRPTEYASRISRGTMREVEPEVAQQRQRLRIVWRRRCREASRCPPICNDRHALGAIARAKIRSG